MGLEGLKTATTGVIAGVVACAAWVFIPGNRNLYNDAFDDFKAVGFLATIVAILAGICVVMWLLSKEVTTNHHRRKTTVFRRMLPFLAVAIVAALITVWIVSMHVHFHFTLSWLFAMWNTRGFVADVVAVGVIVLALCYGNRRSAAQPVPATPPAATPVPFGG